MKRSWITGLTLASVAGTGGAAFARMSVVNHDGSAVEAQAAALKAGTVAPASATTTYRLGTAGTVTITTAGGGISVDAATPATGWLLLNTGAPGTHVEVSFTDLTQTVTFVADVVDGRAVVSLSNIVAGVASTITPELGVTNPNSSTVLPATPVAALTPRTKSPATTTATSRSTTSGTISGTTRQRSSTHESEGGGDD